MWLVSGCEFEWVRGDDLVDLGMVVSIKFDCYGVGYVFAWNDLARLELTPG